MVSRWTRHFSQDLPLKCNLRIYFMRNWIVFVVVLGFYIPPTAKVIWRRGLGLKSHLKNCIIGCLFDPSNATFR